MLLSTGPTSSVTCEPPGVARIVVQNPGIVSLFCGRPLSKLSTKGSDAVAQVPSQPNTRIERQVCMIDSPRHYWRPEHNRALNNPTTPRGQLRPAIRSRLGHVVQPVSFNQTVSPTQPGNWVGN